MACSQPQPGCRFDEIPVPLVCGELYLLQRCNWCLDARQQHSAFGPGPRWAKRSEVSAAFRKSNSDLIAMPFEQNLFFGPDQRDGSLIFQLHLAKNIGTNCSARILTRRWERSA